MIKFSKRTSNGLYIGLGLSHGNLSKLQQGDPIPLDFTDLGAPSCRGLIIYDDGDGNCHQKAITLIDNDPEDFPDGDYPISIFTIDPKTAKELKKGMGRVLKPDLPGISQVLIFVGKTEKRMVAALSDKIGPTTKLHGDWASLYG